MKITMIGTGYVGLVTGTCFADLGHEVMCLDVDKEKINKLNRGIMPIYEPGLSDLVKRNKREGRLFFTLDAKKAVDFADVIFIAVGTPSKKDGSVDLRYVESAAKTIGKYMDAYKVIVDKSTVPVGTADFVKKIIKKGQKKQHHFDLVSNPEFLREGQAIKDFMNPDRIVLGVESREAENIMTKLYKSIERTGKPILITDVKSAELIKYAANTFLATKVSFINEIARLAEKSGADIKMVAKGIGLDERIGPRFLQAGVGYGGSCFPKDVRGLIDIGKKYKVDMKVAKAVDNVNEEQKKYIIFKIKKAFKNKLKGKKIAVWGLSFKPKTDDMREAPSITIINELQKAGAKIIAFDPEAEHNAKKILKNVTYATTPLSTLKGCNALVIVTEWDEFRNLDKAKIKKLLKQPFIFDGRNIYDKSEMEELGFNYFGIGR